MYVYNADLYCDDCGALAVEELTTAGVADTGDSDDFPQYALEGESDSPNHCAQGDACRCAVDLADYAEPGNPATEVRLLGRRLRYVGAPIGETLTDEGVAYVQEMTAHARDARQAALHALWRESFPEAF